VLIERVEKTSPVKPSWRSIEHGIAGSAAIPIRNKDAIVGLIHIGTTGPLRFDRDVLSFLDAIGTIVGLAIGRDRHEQQITRLNAELQERFDEIESFNYSVAHDLRAPVRAVAGFAAILDEEFGGTLNLEGKRYLGLIEKGAVQMGALIDALLSLARVGRQEITRVRVDLSAIAEALAAELRASELDRNVAVTVQPGLCVSGDSAMLRAVLQNLLTNSWKFTRGRDPAWIAFSAERSNGEQIFRVQDNGVGFTPNENLFKPFKRFHGKGFEGTGIGLATVARIIRRHGGRVWAESEPGVGTSFFFTVSEAAS